MAVDTTKYILGSGKLYIAELASGAIPETLFTTTNCVGDIQGGAEATYKPTLKPVKNDFGDIRGLFITGEDVSLKSGVLTWDLETMKKFTVGATYTAGKIIIGGKKSVTQYAIGFEYVEEDGTKLQLKMKGYNEAGWTFKFDPEKETVIDVEFKAITDADGTLMTIEEV